jgi:hypothetical protein
LTATRLPKHLHRHAILVGCLQNELRITGAAFDFLAEVGTAFLEVV